MNLGQGFVHVETGRGGFRKSSLRKGVVPMRDSFTRQCDAEGFRTSGKRDVFIDEGFIHVEM